MPGDLRSRMNKVNKMNQDPNSVIKDHPQEARLVSDALKKYQGKSESELMDELQKAAARGRASGELTNERLDKFASQMLPMIDKNQQQKMRQLLGMLKK